MKRLKELREAKQMSQQALAEIFHVTQQSVYKYEHGLAEPDLDVIIRMADFFHVSVDYLIGHSNAPFLQETISDYHITPIELQVLNYYRTLSPHTQELIQALIQENNK